ncbi:DUF4185 domain-containing protein [Modestobacter sp. I12A-02628]|uniref:DUF4185 domain-containing protein n=1 Tax=Goekera deserti TaxID=2497753 RepID=A0A7K3WCB4_9ACTN|nr:DUF4185 domain-containing protein [Goekera deserti]MPQ98380.1 DUF4185 domain-containing protein [Goekera deserti]NDI48207.1 DUF4185 domain-containing protein [Goekera deserti]NEL53956.1 DUF4185 domain-containing protein [Goekera deserti]
MTRPRTLPWLVFALLVSGCSGAQVDGHADAAPTASSSEVRPAAPTASTAEDGSYQLAPACPPVTGPQLTSAAEVNAMVSQAQLPGWQAADVGASAPLHDGRLVWVYGDTFRAAGYSPTMVANSILVSSGSCLSQVVTPEAGPVIPDLAPDLVQWPMSVVVLPPEAAAAAGEGITDVFLVLSARTWRGPAGPMDFHFRGTSASVFTVTAGGAPQLREVVEITPDDEDATQVNWGAAATVDDGWLYVFGTRLTGERLQFGRELHVARVPIGTPTERSAWEFWDGRDWQDDAERSAVVIGASGGVSQLLSVDVIDGQFVAVSKRDGDLGDFVYSWTATSPVGPWTAQRGLSAPAGYDVGRLTYSPLAHPDVELASGRLLVSVSRNSTSYDSLVADPRIGRPTFAEIPRP